MCPPEDWRRLAEILLEGAGVGGIYLANKSVLSMYGGGRTTGNIKYYFINHNLNVTLKVFPTQEFVLILELT